MAKKEVPADHIQTYLPPGTAEPVLAYLESMRDLQEPLLPPGIAWEDYMGVMREQVTRLIGHAGKLVVRKLSGALVATQEGGFAAGFVRLLRAGAPA